MKRILFSILALLIFVVSCSKQLTTPSFIEFKVKNDSLFVISKNNLPSPLYIKVINTATDEEILNQLEAYSEHTLLQFHQKETDSTEVLKGFKFEGYYGKYPFKEYDTNHIYTLPFQKGYQSKIIQGYDDSFSHKGAFSSKCIDFDMKVGDTIVAARDGVVVKVMQDKFKQGITEEFKGDGNFIMMYHQDNTFSQYVHLKQYGSLVKVGDSVQKNQPIALSGFTGWTTVPHLHFGVYKPTERGLESIPIIIDSIPAKELERGQVIKKQY